MRLPSFTPFAAAELHIVPVEYAEAADVFGLPGLSLAAEVENRGVLHNPAEAVFPGAAQQAARVITGRRSSSGPAPAATAAINMSTIGNVFANFQFCPRVYCIVIRSY